MIKFIKKYLHRRKIEKKIKYINNFVRGRCSHKVFDPELDSMVEEILDYVKNSGKYSYVEYTTIANGLYYLKNINRNLEILFAEDLKSKEPSVEETQNAICEELENKMKE